jgi:hypothetical protein
MASIYKEEEKLEASAQGGGRECGALWAAVPIIKRKDKQYSNDKEYMGKEFLIKDSLTSLAGRWKLKQE